MVYNHTSASLSKSSFFVLSKHSNRYNGTRQVRVSLFYVLKPFLIWNHNTDLFFYSTFFTYVYLFIYLFIFFIFHLNNAHVFNYMLNKQLLKSYLLSIYKLYKVLKIAKLAVFWFYALQIYFLILVILGQILILNTCH